MLLDQLVLFIVALAANTLSALAGGGAGLLQLPALIFLGLPFAIALATHKIASVALGVGATLRHLRAGSLDPKLVLMLLAAGLPGVWLGARWILEVDESLATIALGVMTLAIGLYSWRRPDLGQATTAVRPGAAAMMIGLGVLFVAGVLNGSLTSGTGLIVTLWLVRWFGLDYKTAVAHTLVLVGLGWNGTGALTLGVLGEIAWDWLPALLIGSLIGGYLGAHLAIKGGNRLIKRIFEVVTVLTGCSLILRGLASIG
ncbi:MAG: sulfite exporter TauE/SafE family protein [Halothiobacillaceae bacterium]